MLDVSHHLTQGKDFGNLIDVVFSKRFIVLGEIKRIIAKIKK